MMKFDYKNIHIGECIRKCIKEQEISIVHICDFFRATEHEIEEMCSQKSIDTDVLLGWCQLLKYDFFRIYIQHIILFAPQSSSAFYNTTPKVLKTASPQFRKNVYTKEVIDFILELMSTGEKTRNQIVQEYRIPETTLYKWIIKYSNKDEKELSI